jgi:hypothetical protein
MNIKILISILGIVLDLSGGLILAFTPGKRDKSKETSLVDQIGPYLSKDSPISPQKIFNDLYGDDYERKNAIKWWLGVFCFFAGSIILIASLFL